MMLFPNEQQQLIESSALTWLRKEYGFEQRVRSVQDPHGCVPRVWEQFAEMGWLGLPLPEAAGGFGAGPLATGLLMRAFGRHLVVEPFAACILYAARLIADAGRPDQCEEWLPGIIEGRMRAALAHDEAAVRDPHEARATRARRIAGGWELEGRKVLAVGAPGAELLIVSASLEGSEEGSQCGREQLSFEHRLFVLHPALPGLSVHACATADGGRAADLVLDKVRVGPEALLGEDVDARAALAAVQAEAVVAQCWEAVGAMQAAFEQTADYVRQRQQFGQPLSKFQVVAHRLAEMAVQCEEALAACKLAALRIERGEPELPTLASMTRSKVGRAANFVGKEAVQLHGAMGVSEELAIASTFRKLQAFAQLGGSTASHSRAFGRSMLASGAWRASRTLPPGTGSDAAHKQEPYA
jgi:alkylation response protein AidB-like acyl-CoA dehydrogenase